VLIKYFSYQSFWSKLTHRSCSPCYHFQSSFHCSPNFTLQLFLKKLDLVKAKVKLKSISPDFCHYNHSKNWWGLPFRRQFKTTEPPFLSMEIIKKSNKPGRDFLEKKYLPASFPVSFLSSGSFSGPYKVSKFYFGSKQKGSNFQLPLPGKSPS